jgi:hypothetical protein
VVVVRDAARRAHRRSRPPALIARRTRVVDLDAGAVVSRMLRATAEDACGTLVSIENVACRRGTGGALALGACPLSVAGDTITIGELLEALVVSYDARAVDPSGNAAVVSCEAAFAPSADDGRLVASGGGGCAGGDAVPGALCLALLLVACPRAARRARSWYR